MERLVGIVIDVLRAPDLIAVQEIRGESVEFTGDDEAPAVPATGAFRSLIAAISDAGGPAYEFVEVAPANEADGGEPGFNIRNGLLYRPEALTFNPRGSALPATPAIMLMQNGQANLKHNPARLSPEHPAFGGDSELGWKPSRKSLVAEFEWGNKPLFVVVCHLKSMRSPSKSQEHLAKKQRHAQAKQIFDFTNNIMNIDVSSQLIVLGDMNDVRESKTVEILRGGPMVSLIHTLPRKQSYTYRYGRKSQCLDYILVSPALAQNAAIEIPHPNTDSSADIRASDHDPVLATLSKLQ